MPEIIHLIKNKGVGVSRAIQSCSGFKCRSIATLCDIATNALLTVDAAGRKPLSSDHKLFVS